MEICQLNIAGFYIPAIKPHILKNVFDKNKLKYEISTSGKSINIFEQTLISDENSIYNIIRNIMRTSPELKLCTELGKLTLKLSEYYISLKVSIVIKDLSAGLFIVLCIQIPYNVINLIKSNML